MLDHLRRDIKVQTVRIDCHSFPLRVLSEAQQCVIGEQKKTIAKAELPRVT